MGLSKTETLRMLILLQSQDHAEQIVNAIKNSGLPTRPTQVDNEEDFLEELSDGNWDLLLCAEQLDDLTYETALTHIRKLARDIPVIVLLNEDDAEIATEALQAGAVDALCQEEYQRIALIIRRELTNLYARRAQRRLEVALNEAESRNRLLLDNSRDAVAYIHEGMHIYANHAYAELFDYSNAEELEGMPVVDLVAREDLDNFKNYLKAYSKGESISSDLRFHGIKQNSENFSAMMSLSGASYEGEACTQLIIRYDSGEAVALELAEKLKEAATVDTLTGLGNRQQFEDICRAAINDSRSSGQRAILLYISIDGFSNISANYGISGADAVILSLSQTLSGIIPATQLCRFADYTFTAIVKQADENHAKNLAESIVHQVHEHLIQMPDKRTLQIGVSVGVVVIGETAGDIDVMISRAAAEKSRATEKGGNQISLYDPSENATQSDSAMLELLHNALEKGLFKLMFQPLIDVRGEGGEFYEVYLRLPLANGELLEPEQFLPTAIANKIGGKVDRWVMLQVAKQLKEHVKSSPNTRVLVNLCAESLQDGSLPAWIGKLAKAVSPTGHPIILQFHEEDVVSYLQQAKTLCQTLSAQGCPTSISRFGCSLNPMNTLKHIKAEYIKLDGSFTQDLGDEQNLSTMKKLAMELNGLDKKIIVPFVETPSALSKLWTVGVHYLQGYYLQKPDDKMYYAEE